MIRALTFALLLFTTAARAYDLKRDRTGATVKWQRALMLFADRTLEARMGTAGAREALVSSVVALQQAAGGLQVALTAGEGGAMGFDFAQDAVNRSDVIALDVWEYGEKAVAVTVVTVDARTHAIIDADIAFNLTRNFEVVPDRPSAADRYDVQNTFTHELGHAVGLAHTHVQEAVMFPSTFPQETRKRRFDSDDVQGLAELYPAPVAALEAEPSQPQAGCSTTAGGPGLLLLSLLALRRRARTAAAVALALAPVAAARASDAIARSEKALKVALVGKVTRATTLPPEEGVTVLRTQLEVEVSQCLANPCPATVKLWVPGGSWGNYEQRVGGLEVPRPGEQVGLSRDAGKDAWIRLEKLADEAALNAFFRQHASLARKAQAQVAVSR